MQSLKLCGTLAATPLMIHACQKCCSTTFAPPQVQSGCLSSPMLSMMLRGCPRLKPEKICIRQRTSTTCEINTTALLSSSPRLKRCISLPVLGDDAKRSFTGTVSCNDDSKVPQARGIPIDFTQGSVSVLAYDQPLTGPMNKAYIKTMAAGYDDQEMMSMLLLGLRSKAPLAHQSTINAHTHSVSMGVAKLEKGILKRFDDST